MYNIKDEDPNLLTEEETQKYVADSVVTSECWLTRYEKPVKIQKLWLVGGEVVLWPYIVDGVVYNYPIVRNSIWADSKTLPDPEFQNLAHPCEFHSIKVVRQITSTLHTACSYNS